MQVESMKEQSQALFDKAGIDVVPVSAAIGAEIRNVDLSAPLSDAAFAAIHRAWLDHLVLLFRGQDLTDGDMVAFSKRFGGLDLCPVDENGLSDIEGFPEILVVSNVVEKGKPIGALGAYESVWHTDMSYVDTPPKASALYSLEVPPSGGDTGFLNMYMAYETMPDDLRRRIEGRTLKHDASYNSAGGLRKGLPPVTDVSKGPGAIHPIVRTHPETGRKALFLGRRRHAYICGLPVPESEELLDALWAHTCQERFSWHHKWRVGDLVIWDNRSAMHRRDAFDPNTRRIMHRTQIQGDRPF